MLNLMSYEPSVLVLHVAIVALASLGNVEWLKNWIHPEKKKVYSLVGLAALSVNAFFQMPFIHNAVTWGWNLFSLGLAFMQFGYSALIKLPEKFVDRVFTEAPKQEAKK